MYEYKNNKYNLIKKISFKHPDTREWVPAVLYEDVESHVQYVREEEEFFRVFSDIERTVYECRGCEDDFYNTSDEEKCWSLERSLMLMRKRVGINDVPPYTHKPRLTRSCFKQRGAVYLDHNTDHET